jgi:hypothetical protein
MPPQGKKEVPETPTHLNCRWWQDMTPKELERLLEARNAYAYPWVYISALRGQNIDGVDHPVPSTEQQNREMNEALWTSRHLGLLRSDAPEDTLLGAVSIAYWGFFGSSSRDRRTTPERALSRAKGARDGRKNAVRRPTPESTLEALVQAADQLAVGNIADALRAVNRLPEFGQMSFGSKVLMAMAPDQCGVYDRVIHDALQGAGHAWSPYVVHPNQGMSGRKAEVYQRWCELLARRAEVVNALGTQVSGWTDVVDGATIRRPWRPVDVERAFFGTRDVAVLGAP